MGKYWFAAFIAWSLAIYSYINHVYYAVFLCAVVMTCIVVFMEWMDHGNKKKLKEAHSPSLPPADVEQEEFRKQVGLESEKISFLWFCSLDLVTKEAAEGGRSVLAAGYLYEPGEFSTYVMDGEVGLVLKSGNVMRVVSPGNTLCNCRLAPLGFMEQFRLKRKTTVAS